ncbi:unnamed protein product [Cyprideis torosa]|uniref:Uncharacterized protein n=1 Tax=Cyprideis torosa TaxID=163714 RepID=A0A7R8WFC7_9CRUS|nr:unnamed protein product [Cyprideis torosa]CAG0890466.1 unnamed protein product [Cyprideis torosa]
MSTSTPVSQRVYALRSRGSSPSPVKLPPTPELEKIGSGNGVGVYLLRGEYRSPWAVKKLSEKGEPDKEIKKRLNREAEVLRRLKHSNVIGFRQWLKGADGNHALMMEFGEKSLTHLIQERDEPFPEDKIIRVAQDVVSALQYLHSIQLLLHGDIKSCNILVLGNFKTCKVCDFGVVCKLKRNMKLRKGETYIGTELWSAPEVLGGGDVCDRSDIFSYALTLYEMVALRLPHVVYPRMRKLRQRLGTRPVLPVLKNYPQYSTFLQIFFMATNTDPRSRPSATTIHNGFQKGRVRFNFKGKIEFDDKNLFQENGELLDVLKHHLHDDVLDLISRRKRAIGSSESDEGHVHQPYIVGLASTLCPLLFWRQFTPSRYVPPRIAWAILYGTPNCSPCSNYAFLSLRMQLCTNDGTIGLGLRERSESSGLRLTPALLLLLSEDAASTPGCGLDAVPPRQITHPPPHIRPRRSSAPDLSSPRLRVHASPERHQSQGGPLSLPRTLASNEPAAFLDVSLFSSSPQPFSSFSASVIYSGPCLSSSSSVAQAVSLPLWLLLPLVVLFFVLLLFFICLRHFLRRPSAPAESSLIPLQLFPPSLRLPHSALFHRPLSCPAGIHDDTIPAPVLPPRSASLTSISPGFLTTPPSARILKHARSLSSVTETSFRS